jgi:Trypsin-like peptidase domain/Effector-associated domain 1
MPDFGYRLTGPQMGRLRDTLLTAFDRVGLASLLRFRLDKRITDYAADVIKDPQAVFAVVEGANMEGWWRNLVREARYMRPGDPGLLSLEQDMGSGPQIVETTAPGGPARITGNQLELKIKATQSTFDILTWRERLGEIEPRVCRIEIPETNAVGTGFLVAADVVLTNYHVVEEIIKAGGQGSEKIKLRFDYKVQADGISVNKGKAYGLASNWLADFSPYSPRDLEISPAADPSNDELDYAFLKVDGRPGDDAVGGDTQDPAPVKRGWIKPAPAQYTFVPKTALYIVQHPDGLPMQVAIDSDAILDENISKNRVRYTTTTLPGSSGSPCFNANWEWVALHHSGDPKYVKLGLAPQFNEGIPVSAIADRLTRQGKAELL